MTLENLRLARTAAVVISEHATHLGETGVHDLAVTPLDMEYIAIAADTIAAVTTVGRTSDQLSLINRARCIACGAFGLTRRDMRPSTRGVATVCGACRRRHAVRKEEEEGDAQ